MGTASLSGRLLLLLLGLLALSLAAPDEARGQGPRHFREGQEAAHRGDFDGAIRQYTLAIQSGDLHHPDIFFAFNNRGNAYAARRDFDLAIQDYGEALRLNPKFDFFLDKATPLREIVRLVDSLIFGKIEEEWI